jgi:large subunit ribosomal protein L5e
MYKGVSEVNGEVYDVYEKGEVGERRPFKAALDVGISSTTTGSRSFGAMKGATDGGLYIPHKKRRFPGFVIEKSTERGEKDTQSFNADVHRQHIFGLHVDDYMEKLE